MEPRTYLRCTHTQYTVFGFANIGSLADRVTMSAQEKDEYLHWLRSFNFAQYELAAATFRPDFPK